jgi:hypothetical protein
MLPSGAVGMTSIGGVTKLLYLSVLDYCWCRSLCAPPSDGGAIQLRWPFPAARAQGRAAEPGAGKRGGGPASCASHEAIRALRDWGYGGAWRLARLLRA